jgi:hypothetical protein
MPAGTVEATTLSIARKTNTTGVPTITGTLNQSGGTVTAASLILGNNESANAANLIANYNLTGGTLAATSISAVGTIVGANTVRNLSISGGTVRNIAAADLLINGLNATDQGELNLIVGLSGASLLADASRLIGVGAFTDISGAGILSKDGLGTLALNSAKPVLPAVDVNTGTLRGTSTLAGGLNVDPLAIVAPGNSIGTLSASSAVIAGTLAIEWQDAGLGLADGSTDVLAVTNNLNLNLITSNLALTDFLGSSVANDTAYVLATYGTLTGTFATVTGLPAGYGIDYAYNGSSIAMVVVPEPSALALAALAAPALLRRRRA